MNRFALLLATALSALAAHAAAQDGAGTTSRSVPEVSFHFDRPGLPVPRYQITVHEDGTGTYEGDELPWTSIRTQTAQSAAESDASPQPPARSEPFRQPVTVSPATAHRIFTLARSLKDFNVACASRAKNIADTGTKTLAFHGPASSGSCTYNFSENKNVVTLTDVFFGMAETMDEGRRLEHLHRFDRLGLDAAIGYLAQEVTDGRALELGSIAPTLRSIAGDADVMQRVRLRASQLLSLLPAGQQSSTP